MKSSDWFMLIVLSLLWGGSFYFNEIALRELPVLSVVAARVVIAAVVLWSVALASGYEVPSDIKAWRWFLVMGVLNNVIPFSLIVFGQTTITAGLASILNATTPLFIVLVVALFIRTEKVGGLKVAGLVIGFVGVAIMLGPEALNSNNSLVVGQLAILLAALSYALAGIYGRRFHTAGIAPVVAAAGQVTMSAVVLLPAAMMIDGPGHLAAASGNAWLAVTGLAVLATAVAYILYFSILSSAGSVNLMLVTFLMPVTALLLGTYLLDEPVRLLEIAGMVIIAIALVVIDGRLFLKKTNTSNEA